MPRAQVRSITEIIARQQRGVKPERFQRQPCDTCGSRAHSTARCTGRDDIVLGALSVASANGAYRGELPVRVVPPGFSFLDWHDAEAKPEPAVGQVWYSPAGRPYVIERVRVRVVHVRRKGNLGFMRTVSLSRSRLSRLWYFGGKEVAR